MLSLRRLHEQYKTQDKCMELLTRLRWPAGVQCPRCGNGKVFRLKARAWNWVCKSGKDGTGPNGQKTVCHKRNGYRFSPLVATVFENTNYPLPVWFEVIYLMCQSKKGMSALQIQRQLQQDGRPTAYKTAFYICHRVRAMLDDGDFPQLMGQVEVDETFVGGKGKNRHWDKKTHISGGEGSGKVGVIGAISRKGNVVCRIIENTDTATLDKFVRQTIGKNIELVATDEHSGYRLLKPSGIPHESVSHGQGEYVRGIVHTNNIESFWALLKRGVMGSFHQVSKKYLPLYLNEFSWHHNNRGNPNIFFDAIAGC